MKIIFATIVALATVGFVVGKLDANCQGDGDCVGKSETCISNKCKCSVGYRQGYEQSCVHVIGTSCEANDECEYLPGATCEKNKCICKTGWLLGAKECNKVGGANDECTITTDCIHRVSPPDDQKECKDNKCVCKTNFHVGDNNRCKITRALEQSCEKDDDCFQADNNNNNALVCEDADGARLCKCKKGYKQEGDKCNGSEAKFLLPASFLLLIALSILKM